MASKTLTSTTTVARVNLLPPEIAERARERRVQGALGAGVLGAAVVVGLLYLVQVGRVNDAEEEVAEANARAVALQAERASLQTVVDTYAAVAGKEAVLRTALAQDIAWSNYLNDLMLTVPDNVWLTSMAVSQAIGGATAPVAVLPGAPPAIGTAAFSGMAFDHDDVATWLEVLARQKGYANPYFSSSVETKIGGRSIYAFSSSVVITDAALSHRANRLLGA